MFNHREQIKKAIIEKISRMPNVHKKDIKTIIDQIKTQYLWNNKIKLEELKSAIRYFKENWHELKIQARQMRKNQEPLYT